MWHNPGHDLVVATLGKNTFALVPLTRFAQQVEAATGHCFEDYAALHAWSVEEAEDFWRAAWSFLDLQGEPGETVIDDLHHMPGASWFPDGRVSFAGTILREADDRPAIRGSR